MVRLHRPRQRHQHLPVQGGRHHARGLRAGGLGQRPPPAGRRHGSFLFRVKAGDSLPEFRCDVTTPCSIGVFEVNPADGLLDFAAAVITTVKFAPTADSCPAGLTKSLTGVVASGSFRASLSWAAIACQGSTALDLNPTLGSSPDAKLAFLRGDVDVAVTGDPIGPDDVLRATESMAGAPLPQRSYTYAPATASGLAIVYNMRDFVTGEQIVDLKLTPDLIAKIFTGQISTPDDDGGSMRALNPTHTLPIFTRAVMRAENDADTLQFSTWLYGTARAAYEAGGEQFTHGPLLGWPSTDRYQLRTGADDVALTVLGAENDPQRLGYLGVVDTSTAAFYGLSTAFVLNGAGAFVQPNQDGMAKGIPFAQHIRPDGSMVPANLAAPDAGAYPLAKIGYLVVPTSGLDARPDYRDSLLTALTFAAGPGQRVGDDDRVLPYGYLPLPKDLADAALAVLDKVREPPPRITPGGDVRGAAGRRRHPGRRPVRGRRRSRLDRPRRRVRRRECGNRRGDRERRGSRQPARRWPHAHSPFRSGCGRRRPAWCCRSWRVSACSACCSGRSSSSAPGCGAEAATGQCAVASAARSSQRSSRSGAGAQPLDSARVPSLSGVWRSLRRARSSI